MHKTHRRHLDPWEVLIILIFAGIVGGVLWVPTVRGPGRDAAEANPVQSAREIEAFRRQYGPSHFSEREEEWMIRDYFGDRRGGVFVDVGANHYKIASKTYYLETQLGWSGLAVEPQREFAADYERYRPRTRFRPFFVSETSNETARLYVLKRSSMVASSDKRFVEQFGEPDEVREVPTITLTDLLDAEHIQHVDLLSIDIELHEPEALRGFDIERFKPSLVCIEALLPVRQQILEYFASHGYVIVGKYIWVDLENMYFVPAGTLQPHQAGPGTRSPR